MGKEQYEIIDHGVEHSQYFQGCGTSFTPYADCFTGIGNTPNEALEDALEQAAMCQYDVEGIPNDLSNESNIPEEALESEGCELYHHVSLRIGQKCFKE